jgi:hypothetical protein
LVHLTDSELEELVELTTLVAQEQVQFLAITVWLSNQLIILKQHLLQILVMVVTVLTTTTETLVLVAQES